MSGATEGFVQHAPDSTGKKIRTGELTAVEPDGTVGTVEQQKVQLVDRFGFDADVDGEEWKHDLLREAKLIRVGIQRLLELFDGDGNLEVEE